MSARNPQPSVEAPGRPDGLVLQEIRDLLHGYVPKGYLTLPQACQYLGGDSAEHGAGMDSDGGLALMDKRRRP